MFEDDFTLWSIPAFGLKILLLLVIVFIVLLIHELGHLLIARVLSLRVDTIEIGRGREVWARQDKHETPWQLRAIPFGAHVKISEQAFAARSYAERMLTILAGPLINLITPFLLFSCFYLILGQPSMPPVIVGIEKNYAAEKAGLKPGDRILEVNGNSVSNFAEIWRYGYEQGATESFFKIQRGEKILEKTVKPHWSEYRDTEGVDRANVRYGILWQHAPFRMTAFDTIAGMNVKNKPKLAHEIFLNNLDKPLTVQIKATESNPNTYKIYLSAKSNPHLGDKKHEEYKKIYLGPSRDNFYNYRPPLAQIYEAALYTIYRIWSIVKLPFQILPIDPYALSDEAAVNNPDTPVQNALYSFIHKLAIASIIIGFINLLPIPTLDGGQILIQTIETLKKQPLTAKAKAKIFAFCFLALYFSVFAANMDKVPRYIDSRLKKVHQFMDQITSETDTVPKRKDRAWPL